MATVENFDFAQYEQGMDDIRVWLGEHYDFM